MGIWCDRLYHLGITSAFTAVSLLVGGMAAMAQSRIEPDETLGDERSEVIQNQNFNGLPVEVIRRGARRGQNLFHSFREFNVETGRGAYFESPAGIESILSRVTGENVSNIDGVLGTFGDAQPNVFLINPNGIIFGPNASLDVGGSFAATTADGIQFGEQGFFSATNPEVPSGLLTIDPSAFFFNQLPAGNIAVRSTVPIFPNSISLGLRVADGESLLLLGGNVSIDGGGVSAGLNAFGGRVEIGAVGGIGSVGLNSDGSLTFPDQVVRGDVIVSNRAFVDVALENGGAIAVTAGNIRITGRSVLLAGVYSESGTLVSQAGDIRLDATGGIQVEQSSRIFNRVYPDVVGNAGNILITTGTLFVTGGSQLRSRTNGEGNAGSVIITASNRVRVQGTSLDGQEPSAVASVVEGSGQGGRIEITTPILEVLDSAQISAATFGQGDTGSVIITASDRVRIEGMGAGQGPSGVLSAVEKDGSGQSGNIEITTPILEVLNGGQLSASIRGEGGAGDVIIRASDRVRFEGVSIRGLFPSGAFSTVGQNGSGPGGNVEITTAILEVLNGAQLIVATRRNGNAGNIIIRASDRVRFEGTSTAADGRVLSAAISTVTESGIGQGGNIRITTPILEVFNGAQLQANTEGQGSAGSVIIRASDRVMLDGVSRSGYSGGIFTTTQATARGHGGTIDITAPTVCVANGAVIDAGTYNSWRGGDIILQAEQFEATNGGQLITSTLGSGRAGNITLDVDQIQLSGSDPTFAQRIADETLSPRVANEPNGESGLFAGTQTGSTGSGGRITINSNTLMLEDGALISAESNGTGPAGDIQITSNTVHATDSDIRTAATRSGGDITIQADAIQLRGDSDIRTNSGVAGGNITLQASSILAFDDSDIFAFAGEQGGDIALKTPAFFGEDYRSSDSESQSDPDRLDGNGRVDLNASGQVSSGTITAPDTSFIQNSLTELSDTAIDTENLVADSCVVRSQEVGNTFTIVGAGGLPQRPGDLPLPAYATSPVRSTPDATPPELDRPWQIGDPIVEPDGAYQLEDGRIVLSRECD